MAVRIHVFAHASRRFAATLIQRTGVILHLTRHRLIGFGVAQKQKPEPERSVGVVAGGVETGINLDLAPSRPYPLRPLRREPWQPTKTPKAGAGRPRPCAAGRKGRRFRRRRKPST